ncbi:YfhH family protein [Viridibacillus sp. YIM B01967]|uniref:YfhH family protein n=1 Tax=Viridibacillus soli TaxID=2798301 RepID=A0ABS1H8R5_9BACL|nr:YfhH family protein [Viridibacillus soli]MBK3495806.1 YfhH family protein [Viridibacillus soli]
MDKKYSDMTPTELRGEIAKLKEKARKAEQLGILNEFAVYERKSLMAQAFLINPDDFKPGEMYRIEGDPGVFFQLEYLKGRFAWGYRLGGDRYEEALPISMLKPVKGGF